MSLAIHIPEGEDGPEVVEATVEESITTWNTKMQNAIDNIRDLKPSDRLDTVEAIARTIGCLRQSLDGWSIWISSWVMKGFTMEELTDIMTIMKEHCLFLLEMDKKYTNLFEERKPKFQPSLPPPPKTTEKLYT